MRLYIKFILLSVFSSQALSATTAEDINKLSNFVGEVDYCQYYYEDNNKPFKYEIMQDYNRKISRKVIELFSSKAESDMASKTRQKSYLNFKGSNSKSPEKACEELDRKLMPLFG